ncbi:MAG TPA: DUF885 domain-containing protein [Acidimicrobiia bacterium]
MTLETLADRYWKMSLEAQPTIATVRGIHDYDDQLPSLDEDWVAGMIATFNGLVTEAEGLDTVSMTTQEMITHSLLLHQCRSMLGRMESPFRVASIDPFLGPHTRLLNDTRQNTVTDRRQAEALLGRYRKVPEFLTGALQVHLKAADLGQTPALASVTRVLSQLDGYLDSDLGDDPFLALKVPGDGRDWREKAEDLVKDTIRPAFAEYRDELRAHIAPLSRSDERCGLLWMSGGEQIYADLVEQYVQLPMSPQEIHDIGQEWATEINAAEWIEIGERAFGLETLEDIFGRLHSDPELRFGSEDQMLEHARDALERAWAEVDDWFGHRPATPCDVVPVPPATAPAMPPAYYLQPPVDGSRPGTYFLNTYRPEERDLFEYESIHFHEGIPGHHFDRSLASELEGIPTFRRYAMVYAHTEGWGLYSERLADEMGLYSSDVDRLGMVSADAWRAGRLVTDTGIHALGWSRQQAIDFLREWTPIGLLTVEQEVDRYIAMAGQALSYKMGQLEIMRLRRKAEKALGTSFDIKGFHDTMLINGPMPLPMLATAVNEWMEETG